MQKRATFLKDASGFTLIELALVLAILGVIAGFSLPLLSHVKNLERKRVTLQHQELVLTALGAYVARHYQLPCPADPLLQNGLSRLSCNDVRQNQSFGLVPFRTLGIPEQNAKDGFGHVMHYAVHPALTEKNAYCRDVCENGTQPPVFLVLDERGQSVVDLSEKVAIAALILSEGEAYKRPVSPQEIENMAPSLKFHSRPFAQNVQQPFRHSLTWASRDILITYYGQSSCVKSPLPVEQEQSHPRDLLSEPDPLFY
jgi:prepilin-type N-terminal cleavage/methylation domain-containing protein